MVYCEDTEMVSFEVASSVAKRVVEWGKVSAVLWDDSWETRWVDGSVARWEMRLGTMSDDAKIDVMDAKRVD